MLDPAHPITPFFDDDIDRVLASLAHIAGSSGPISSTDTLWREAGKPDLKAARGGIFCQRIFGPQRAFECACGAVTGVEHANETCERCGVVCGDPAVRAVRFGHVVTAGVVHPAVYPHLVEHLHHDTPDLVAIAHGKKALRDGVLIADPIETEDGDLIGPRGLAEALRRVRPDHPLLPLCTITHIPIPPPASRPLRSGSAPEQIDPWIGPVNEAWLGVIERAGRDLRLAELAAPPIILANEAGMLQQAFDIAFAATRFAEAKLVPPMLRGLDHDVVALAFAGPERLVIQYGDATRVVDISGRDVHQAPASGCRLRGVVAHRFAVFHELRHDVHPMMTEQIELWPATYAQDGWVATTVGELSVLDVETGRFLEVVPDAIPRDFVFNDQPEELFLGARNLRVGGDRPSALAYTHDLRFAWVGEDQSTEIIELATGLPMVYPAMVEEVTTTLSLVDGTIGEREDDDGGHDAASAIAFAHGRWLLLWNNGIVTDHLGADPIALVPPPIAAAFDPSGTRLAVISDDEVVILDPRARMVVARFPA
jgi:hypothetical protein